MANGGQALRKLGGRCRNNVLKLLGSSGRSMWLHAQSRRAVVAGGTTAKGCFPQSGKESNHIGIGLVGSEAVGPRVCSEKGRK